MEMADPRSSIENTLYRYAWTYDMDELEDIGSCFTSDAEVTFMDTGLKSGRDAVAAEMRRRHDKYADGSIPYHVVSNIYITDVTDQQARVRSWWTFFVERPDGTSSYSGAGWYDDIFAPEDGEWRIKHRRVLRLRDR
jgi:SnoaL-like domain